MALRQSRKLAILAVLSIMACREDEAADPVILSLDGTVIRRSEFAKHVRTLEAQGGEALSPEVLPAILGSFLEERVLVLEARARGLIRPDSGAAKEQEAVQEMLGTLVSQGRDIPRTEVVAYYESHPAEFDTGETVTLRQILVPTEAEARDVRRRLRKDQKSFEALARARSKAPEASTGGLMGTFSRGQLPLDLEAAAFALAAGGTSDVLHTSLGYHILRVDSRTDARRATLDESEGRIRATLLRESSDQKVRQFVSELMARAKVNHAAAKLPPRHP
ncbi:MAG TPA: peptidyl-prolyl cis-trans isomerase [Vicinamibacteria bacterium]